MRFNEHSDLPGAHAFLSPSSYHWVNYTAEKLEQRYLTSQASLYGVDQHVYAAEAIALREFQMSESTTLGLYINECIEFRMEAEVVLYYSDNCFGTADAISFRGKRLRISDLKTGVSRTSEHQLEVYAALFCLEYGKDPYDLTMELRIYQFGECRYYEADPKYIAYIMEKIVVFDQMLTLLRTEEP